MTDSIPAIHRLCSLGRTDLKSSEGSHSVAILADSSIQILASALTGFGRHHGVPIDVYEGPFDQVELQVLDGESEFRKFKPQTVVLYLSVEKFADSFSRKSQEERDSFASEFVDRVKQLNAVLVGLCDEVIVFNLASPGDSVFGNFGNKVIGSLTSQIRLANVELQRLAQNSPNLHIYDLAALESRIGRERLFDAGMYYTSQIAITPDSTRFVVRDLLAILMARRGAEAKCVILDLDNTLWGGVVGDDGIEGIEIGELGIGRAFSHLQNWLKQLSQRGVVLCVCSKNTDSVARAVFETHPDMVLKIDDFAVFVANWHDKASNIRQIHEIVHVDYRSIVFIDDNPAERELVRRSFPSMIVPELPTDPSAYLGFLQSLNLFEASGFTATDQFRTETYQAEVQRHTTESNYVTKDEFLSSLEMVATITTFRPIQFARISQLTMRSNQFNLRTKRYDERQIREIANNENNWTLAVELRDKFGDSGLVSVVVADIRGDVVFIDTWVMSCRVLGRAVEQATLNVLVETAQRKSVGRIMGEYIPSLKNALVSEHFKSLGFSPSTDANQWILDVEEYTPIPTTIEVICNDGFA